MNAAGDGGMTPAAVRVKEEREWDGASEAAAVGLYPDHEVKLELVLGPERLEPQDIAYALQESRNRTDTGIHMKQELVKKEGLEIELLKEACCWGNSCEEQIPRRTCFVKLEHISIDPELHTCLICQRAFVDKLSLTSHKCINSEEESSDIVKIKKDNKNCKKKKKYSCDTCGKWFAVKASLIVHFRIHTGEKTYLCEVCNKQFLRRFHLINHNRVHTGEKPYKCDVCKKVFALKHHLASHYRTHTGEKSYSCEVCKKQFSRRSNLARHQVTHTREKPYSCDVCKKQFSQKCAIFRHQLVHTGQKLYSCEVCKKQFTQKSSIARHQLIHTGQKPYSCEVCKKRFTSKSSVASHQVIHTREKSYK